ncbi:putative isopropanol dehydrogenase [Xylogone sp. PMI_703]|nr:putative isopropanol dehydrogenase [Xylogone sp. PMI_703]
MATHKALVLHARDKPLSLETVPRPTAKAGEAVIRMLRVGIVPYMADVLNGTRPYPLSLPMTPGNTAIGRVHEVGPDAVELTPGQLVFCDITIRARDNPDVSILFGVHNGGSPASQKLMDGEWRNATYAEYSKFPLENVYPMNEDLLLNKLGYTLSDLSSMPYFLVPYGGLAEVDVKPGEIVIVAPATGRYGGAAVTVALAMGATVIAAGRNKKALDALATIHESTGRLRTVVFTENVANDTEALKSATGKPNGADACIDLSPPAAGSGILAASIGALRPFGRCAIMGGMPGNIDIPYLQVMFKSLRLQGRFMYSRSHILRVIQLMESGLLSVGAKAGLTKTKEYGLESIYDGLKAASENQGWGTQVLLAP